MAYENSSSPSDTEPPLIAIVDDDALARDGIRELVQSFGYRTATFSSAEHFLQSSVITETTCLITDLQMPDKTALNCKKHCVRRDITHR